MQSLKNFKALKASSVMESVIAISIISVCALVAFIIYLNVIQQNKSIHYFNAKHNISLLIEQAITQKDYTGNTYNFNGYAINKNVEINQVEQTATLTFTFKTGSNTTLINKIIPYEE